jgi:hypothetical protein
VIGRLLLALRYNRMTGGAVGGCNLSRGFHLRWTCRQHRSPCRSKWWRLVVGSLRWPVTACHPRRVYSLQTFELFDAAGRHFHLSPIVQLIFLTHQDRSNWLAHHAPSGLHCRYEYFSFEHTNLAAAPSAGICSSANRGSSSEARNVRAQIFFRATFHQPLAFNRARRLVFRHTAIEIDSSAHPRARQGDRLISSGHGERFDCGELVRKKRPWASNQDTSGSYRPALQS